MFFNSSLKKADGKLQLQISWPMKVFSSILPWLGCFYQQYSIMAAYFDYASVTIITNFHSDTLKPPVLVLCVLFDSFQEKLDANGKPLKLKPTTNPTQDQDIDSILRTRFANLTTSKQMSRIVMYQPHHANTLLAEQPLLSSQLFFDSSKACFSVMYKDEDIFLFNNASSPKVNLVVSTNRAWHFGKYLQLAFYSRRRVPFYCDNDENHIKIAIINPQSINGSGRLNVPLTFEESEQQLLPSLYATDCLDYSSIGLSSKAYCFQHCLIERSLRHTGVIPTHSFIPPEQMGRGKFNATLLHEWWEQVLRQAMR